MPGEPTAASIAGEPVIRVRGLVKRYADIRAVDGIDFEVRAGEVFGLLGPNGAGKTTTVEILEGLRAPDAGEAIVLGIDVAKDAEPLKPRIGVSLQTASMYPKLTVFGGAAFAPLWVCAAVLLGWLVVCFGIAARKFEWQ